ncbi:uncharacterized protein LOC111101829 isoform X2 [Crassostrea virginica]
MEQKTHTMVLVKTCPKTHEEIKVASEALACGNDEFQNNQYMCLPNTEKTSLVEFCYDGIMGIQVEGNCLEVNATNGTLITQSCKEFSSGCPQIPFWNFEFYKYPACLDINPRDNCYTFLPSCSHEGDHWNQIYDNNSTSHFATITIVMTLLSMLMISMVLILFSRRKRSLKKFKGLLKEMKRNNRKCTETEVSKEAMNNVGELGSMTETEVSDEDMNNVGEQSPTMEGFSSASKTETEVSDEDMNNVGEQSPTMEGFSSASKTETEVSDEDMNNVGEQSPTMEGFSSASKTGSASSSTSSVHSDKSSSDSYKSCESNPEDDTNRTSK